MGDVKGAKEELEESLRIKPDFTQNLVKVASVYIKAIQSPHLNVSTKPSRRTSRMTRILTFTTTEVKYITISLSKLADLVDSC